MKKPPRFLMTWHGKYKDGEFSKFNWKQRTYERRPKTDGFDSTTCPFLAENLETGAVLATNFGLREHAHFATAAWPVRDAALKAFQRYQNRKIPTPEELAAKTLKQLRTRQLAWQRKIKTGHTRLAKVNTAIKRLIKRFPNLAT